MAREELKWQNIDADFPPAVLKVRPPAAREVLGWSYDYHPTPQDHRRRAWGDA
jgi:hypothetical protein